MNRRHVDPLEEEAEEPQTDHSGTRLVILLFALPVCCLVSWMSMNVARSLGTPLTDHVTGQRIGYVAGGLALAAMALFFYRSVQSYSQPVPMDDSLPDEFPQEDIGTWD